MRRGPTSASLSPALAAAVLVALAISGLLSGLLAHVVIASLATPAATPAAGAPTAAVLRPSPTPTARASASLTPVGPDVQFSLSLSATPQRLAAGMTLRLTALASAKGTGQPVVGLTCALGAQSGSAPLLAVWPSPGVTDGQGMVSWQIVVPSVPPGPYHVEVRANGTQHSYSSWAFATVYVTG